MAAYTMSTYHKWDPRSVMQSTVSIGGVFTPATLATGDTFKFFYIPPGVTLQHIGLALPDLDTNGAPALTLSVGDSSSGTLFVSASTAGQTGAALTLATGLPKRYTTANYLLLTATAGAATAALLPIPFYVSLAVDANTYTL